MKDGIKKVSVSVILAVCELLLGLLLLINPVGLVSVAIIAIGIILILLGVLNLYKYCRLPKEEAAKTWDLAVGAGLLAIGISFVSNQGQMVQMIGTMTTLYGGLTLAGAFMKLQMGVDALRGSRPYWYLMAISFAATAILSTLLFTNPFGESAIWIISGIVLLMLAVLDAAYFILGRKKKDAASEQ